MAWLYVFFLGTDLRWVWGVGCGGDGFVSSMEGGRGGGMRRVGRRIEMCCMLFLV